MKNYIYNLNKNSLLFLGILFVMISSCKKEEDILREVPLDFLAPENAYTTFDGIYQGINGLHAYNRDNWWFEMNTRGGSTLQDIAWWSIGTDEAFYGENPGGGILSNYTLNLTSTYASVNSCWQQNYSMIQKVNMLIESINASDTKIWKNEAQKRIFG